MKINQAGTRRKPLTVILCVGVIFAIAVYFFALPPVPPQTSVSLVDSVPTAVISEPGHEPVSDIAANVPTDDNETKRVHLSQLQQPGPTSMPDQAEQYDDSLWRIATNISESEKRAIGGDVHDNIDNRAYIILNRQAIANLGVGDNVELYIPQQERSYTGSIEEVIEHDEQNTSWTGHLEAYGTDYPIIISQSESGTIATLDTPEGQYFLEANGENARLTPTYELKKHIDPSQPDFIDLEEENTPAG